MECENAEEDGYDGELIEFELLGLGFSTHEPYCDCLSCKEESKRLNNYDLR